MIFKFSDFISEHKFWGKSIYEFLDWIKSKSDKYWIFFDSETTGLPSDPYETQLTQISCLVTKYDPKSNEFTEVDSFNKKLKLTKNIQRLIERLMFNQEWISVSRYAHPKIFRYRSGCELNQFKTGVER